MRIEGHLQKIESLKKTMSKLDNSEDHETIVELCMLISAHYINAALHASGRMRADKDIKHNRIPGTIKREGYFDEKGKELAALFRELEEMRPSQVYGIGRNGDTAYKAREILSKISKICREYIND